MIFLAGPISNLVTKPTAPLPNPGTYPGGGAVGFVTRLDIGPARNIIFNQ